MGKFVITSGGVTVRVSDGIADAIDRTVRRIAGDVVVPMERQANSVASKARARWPDKGRKKSPRATGRSRRAFDVRSEVSLDPNTGAGLIRVRVINTATDRGFHYAKAIRSRVAGTTGFKEPKKPWAEFVAKPMRKQSKDLAVEIGDAVARLMRGT